MATSWRDARQLDLYLEEKLLPGEKLLLEARLINEPGLREELEVQRKTIDLIRTLGQMKLKRELEMIHTTLFADPEKKEFRQKVINLFTT